MVVGELLVKLEADVHGMFLPDQLVANVAIAPVQDDQLGVLVLHDLPGRFGRNT